MSSTRDPKEPTAEELKEQKFYGFEEDVSGIVVPEILPLLPLRGVVIFPSAIVPLLISRGSSLGQRRSTRTRADRRRRCGGSRNHS